MQMKPSMLRGQNDGVWSLSYEDEDDDDEVVVVVVVNIGTTTTTTRRVATSRAYASYSK